MGGSANVFTGDVYDGIVSLRMEGNTWKTQNIPQTGLSRSSRLRLAIKVPLKGELQGIGIGDGSHQLLYITQGTQYGWNDAWVNYRYFNTLVANQWNYYEIPIGEDWYNKYGYYPVIDKIHYINDNDACNGIVLFDAISIESEGGVVYFDDVSVVKKNYVEVEGGERVYYYHNDHLGTPQVMTDISGNVVWKGDYEPFGKVNIVVENIENNFRFPGQYYISETGLYYNWWRWYKSETGRYMELDPLINIGSQSLFGKQITEQQFYELIIFQKKDYEEGLFRFFSKNNPYAIPYNNPLRYIDESGLYGKCESSEDCKLKYEIVYKLVCESLCEVGCHLVCLYILRLPHPACWSLCIPKCMYKCFVSEHLVCEYKCRQNKKITNRSSSWK